MFLLLFPISTCRLIFINWKLKSFSVLFSRDKSRLRARENKTEKSSNIQFSVSHSMVTLIQKLLKCYKIAHQLIFLTWTTIYHSVISSKGKTLFCLGQCFNFIWYHWIINCGSGYSCKKKVSLWREIFFFLTFLKSLWFCQILSGFYILSYLLLIFHPNLTWLVSNFFSICNFKIMSLKII